MDLFSTRFPFSIQLKQEESLSNAAVLYLLFSETYMDAAALYLIFNEIYMKRVFCLNHM